MFRLKSRIKSSILSFVLLALSTSACSGMGDWTVSGLPGGYEIWKINTRSVVLCLPNVEHPTSAKKIIGPYVFEIWYNDTYICAKQADVPDDLEKAIDKSNPNYYIVDVTDGTCLGPFSEKEFDTSCQEIGIDGSLEWMDLNTLRRLNGNVS